MAAERDVEAGLLPPLPKQMFEPISVEHMRGPPKPSWASLAFKAYVVTSGLVLWTAHALLLRASLRGVSAGEAYFGTTAVFLSEWTKWVAALGFVVAEAGSPVNALRDVRGALGRASEMAKTAVPSVLYAFQNNLDFLALAHIEPSTFVVTSQLKVVTTAVMMVALLGRSFSKTRWAAMLALMGGVALVQLDGVRSAADSGDESQSDDTSQQSYTFGVLCVVGACFLSGFAGVWFEKILKDRSTDITFWQRNLQLYTSGILMSGIVCAVSDGSEIGQLGFFHGYTISTWLIIGMMSAGGLYISLMMKHLDNILKTFASSVSIIAIVIGSIVLFDLSIGILFFVGTALVCSSLVAYNIVSQ